MVKDNKILYEIAWANWEVSRILLRSVRIHQGKANFSILNVVVNIQIYIWIADEWLYKTSSNQNKDYLRIICLICSQRVSFYPKGFLSQFLLTGKLSVLTTFEMQNRWSGKGWTGKKYWGNSSLLPSPYVRAFRLVKIEHSSSG